MADYPIDFFEEILRRVPLEPLMRFRLVCKTWRQIIDNPRFTRSHVRNHIGDDQIIIRNNFGNSLYKLSLDSICYSESRYSEIPMKWIKAKDLEISVHPGFSRIVPVASCDGLILFRDHRRVPRALWNPLTREYLQLPLLDEIMNAVEDQELPSLGIGYDCANDDYKVARVSQVMKGGSYVLKTLVYSLKSDSWTRIGDFPNCYAPYLGHGVFVNGEVYWIANVGEKEQSVESIITLDFSTEAYRVVPLPGDPFSPLVGRKLDVVGGCLFLSYFNEEGWLDAWMMTRREGADLWRKLFSFAELKHLGINGSLRTVAYLKSKGMVLIQHDQNDFIWLDIVNKTSKKIALKGLRKHLISHVYQESAVRLNKSGRVDGVRSVDPAKRKSLKLSLSTSNVWNCLDVWEVC